MNTRRGVGIRKKIMKRILEKKENSKYHLQTNKVANLVMYSQDDFLTTLTNIMTDE